MESAEADANITPASDLHTLSPIQRPLNKWGIFLLLKILYILMNFST
jgi:hypothetical protein